MITIDLETGTVEPLVPEIPDDGELAVAFVRDGKAAPPAASVLELRDPAGRSACVTSEGMKKGEGFLFYIDVAKLPPAPTFLAEVKAGKQRLRFHMTRGSQ